MPKQYSAEDKVILSAGVYELGSRLENYSIAEANRFADILHAILVTAKTLGCSKDCEKKLRRLRDKAFIKSKNMMTDRIEDRDWNLKLIDEEKHA